MLQVSRIRLSLLAFLVSLFFLPAVSFAQLVVRVNSAQFLASIKPSKISVSATVFSATNLNSRFSTFPLRAEFWVGSKCASLTKSNSKLLALAGENYGYALRPFESTGILSMSTGGRFIKLKKGTYRASIAILDDHRLSIYGAAYFKKKIRIK